MRPASISVPEARALYGDADSAHDFDHVLRVVALADKLARAEGADPEIVRAAALLHDLARTAEDSSEMPLDHAELSAVQARSLLLARGADEEFADRVAAAIRAHRFRGEERPGTLEGQVLFDADKLDSIGAIGTARAFAVAGALHQHLYTEVDVSAATRDQHNSEHSPVAEFQVKLSRLRERLYTPSARALGEERHRFMVDFFERLRQEVMGEK